MPPKDLPSQHVQLVREIEAHTYRYYVLDDPVVSDAEFELRRAHRDVLKDKVSGLERLSSELQSEVAPFGFRIGLVTATTSRS